MSIIDEQIELLKKQPRQISAPVLGRIVGKTAGALAQERFRNSGFPFIKIPGSQPYYDREVVIDILERHKPGAIMVNRVHDPADAL